MFSFSNSDPIKSAFKVFERLVTVKFFPLTSLKTGPFLAHNPFSFCSFFRLFNLKIGHRLRNLDGNNSTESPPFFMLFGCLTWIDIPPKALDRISLQVRSEFGSKPYSVLHKSSPARKAPLKPTTTAASTVFLFSSSQLLLCTFLTTNSTTSKVKASTFLLSLVGPAKLARLKRSRLSPVFAPGNGRSKIACKLQRTE